MRSQSLIISAFSLAFSPSLVEGRAYPQVQVRNANAQSNGFLGRVRELFKKAEDALVSRQESGVCYEDDYYLFLNNSTIGEAFCQSLLQYSNTTVVVDYTPTSTVYDEYTTFVNTQYSTVRTTPVSTTTVTVTGAAAKLKHRAPEITGRAMLTQEQVSDVFAMFRRQAAADNDTVADDSPNAMSASFSSACSCQTYGGPTVTETYTVAPVYETISGFARTTTTIVTTRTDAVSETTTTVTVAPANSTEASVPAGTAPAPESSPAEASPTGSEPAPASSPAGIPASTTSSSGANPTPTSPAFSCPDNDNTTVSQMIGNERFDYLILCDTDIAEPTFYGSLYFQSFSQCIGACSANDAQFNSPVCQGVSYFPTVNVNGYNCFMKTAGNNTVFSEGTDSAILQRIVVGIDENNAAGTTTEAAPFSTETPTGVTPEEMSSMVSSMMGNSTTSMPVITPGPNIPVSGLLVNGPYTAYSTFVSAGSTYSSGTVFSTRYTSDGVWYESYYTSYTVAWASATTEYAYGAQGTAVASSNNSVSSVQSGNNGEYYTITETNTTTYFPEGYNVTQVFNIDTFAANGTKIDSTATTSYYTFATAMAGSGGASGGGSSGNITSLITASAAPGPLTGVYSTQTVIYNSGGTAGGSGFAASGYVTSTGGSPYTSATTIVNTYGTAFGSGFVASGMVSGMTGSTGDSGSGALITPTPIVSSTVIINTYGTAGASGYAASGGPLGTAGASSYLLSGSAPTPVTSTSTNVVINSYGTAGESGAVASGAPLPLTTISSNVIINTYGTAGGSGSAASGAASSSPMTGTAPVGTAPVGTAPGVPSSFGTSGASSTLLSGYLPPSESPSFSFGAPSGSRTPGAESSSVPIFNSLTGAYTPPGASVTPSPSGNTTAPIGTDTMPASYGFSAPSGPREPFPEGTPSITPSPSGNQTAPPASGTLPPSYGFSAPSGPREPFSETTRSVTPSPSGNETAPPASGTLPPSYGFSAPSGPRGSGSPETSSNATALTPTAYMTYTPPVVTGPSPYPSPNFTAPTTSSPSYGFSAPSGPRGSGYPETTPGNDTFPVPTGTGSPSFSFSAPTGPRGTGPVSSGTAPITTGPVGTGTAPTAYSPFPTIPSTCLNGTIGTTTVFSTVTEYGCYSTCLPYGGYGPGPQSFGPPVFSPPFEDPPQDFPEEPEASETR